MTTPPPSPTDLTCAELLRGAVADRDLARLEALALACRTYGRLVQLAELAGVDRGELEDALAAI